MMNVTTMAAGEAMKMMNMTSHILAENPHFQQRLSMGEMRVARTTWLVMQILGSHILLPVLVVTFLATGVVRHPLMINMCCAWIFTGVISCLLFYVDQYENPSEALCYLQASMIFATPPMCSSALTGLMYSVWRSYQDVNKKVLTYETSRAKFYAWLLLPWVNFVVFAIAGTIIVVNNPTHVTLTRHYFYCSVPHSPFSIVTALTTALYLALPVVLTGMLIRIIFTNWLPLRKARLGAGSHAFFALRVVTIGILVTICFCFSVYTAFVPSIAPDMILAAIPVFLGILFGSSRDAWHTWLRRSPDPDPVPEVRTEGDIERVYGELLKLPPPALQSV